MNAMDNHGNEPATDELVVHLGNLFSQLQSSELLVRRRDPAGVHQMRVGLRTMRSLLATYRPLIRDPDGFQELRAELGWLSGELATARDLEVVRQRLLPEAGEDPGLTKLIEDALGTAKDLTRDRVVAALDSERYAALQRNLADALRGPGLLVEHTTMDAELRGLVLHEVRRLRGRMRQAVRANTDEERSLALHDVRKAAKRVRYAAEALQTTYGKAARRLARRASADPDRARRGAGRCRVPRLPPRIVRHAGHHGGAGPLAHRAARGPAAARVAGRTALHAGGPASPQARSRHRVAGTGEVNGSEIFLSESTVKTHVGAILRKLGVRDRVQIVVHAHEHGLR